MAKQTEIEDTLASPLAAHPLVRRITDERTVMIVISLNGLVLFLHGFMPIGHKTGGLALLDSVLIGIDYVCLLYFILEMVLKLGYLGARNYFRNSWNTFDFLIVVASLPSLLIPIGIGGDFAAFTALRATRLVRFLRFMRFIPSLPRLLDGAKRALRASVGILLVLMLYNFIFALAGLHIFGPGGLGLPEFSDPLTAMYTMFKVFTIEGWYEVGDSVCHQLPPVAAHFVRLFFIAAVVTGGLIILGLLNAVFVDEMSGDLARQTEEEVEEVASDINRMAESILARLDEISSRLERLESGRGPDSA